MNKRHSAFTLVEILVVISIIALLAALLFPAFGRAREDARQKSCASNLQQIGFAVAQYRKDEGEYPDSLVDILAEGTGVADQVITNGVNNGYKLDGKATGYLKSGQNGLTCPDDDTLSATAGARSSYGSLSKNAAATALTVLPATIPSTTDAGQFVWNYWGMREDGFAYSTPYEAQAATPTPLKSYLLVTPTLQNGATTTNPVYNARIQGNLIVAGNDFENVLKYSMSNRFAPSSTIITHCVYHRLPTANGLAAPTDLYTVPEDSKNAKDIVLRIDNSAAAVDVTNWKTTNAVENIWQKQTP